MKHFIVHNAKGEILRTGFCQDRDFIKQASHGELVIEGKADKDRQKIVDGEVVDKTPEEIESDNPVLQPIPFEERPAIVSNAQLQEILDRIAELENRNV